MTVPRIRATGPRLLVAAGSSGVGFAVISRPASAHGVGGHGSGSVAFPVALWIPVLAAVGGGVLALVLQRSRTTGSREHQPGEHRTLVVFLGGVFAVVALASDPVLGLLGGSVGALATVLIRRQDGGRLLCSVHAADVSAGGITTHRVFEGVALASVYAAGTAIGLVGVLVVAGHAALETMAIGGIYATHPIKAIGVIAVVQIGYVLGALAGVNIGGVMPLWVQTASLGLVAGALLVASLGEQPSYPVPLNADGSP